MSMSNTAYAHQSSKNTRNGNLNCSPKIVSPRVGIEVRVPIASTNSTPHRIVASHPSKTYSDPPIPCNSREVQYQRGIQIPKLSKSAHESTPSYVTSNPKIVQCTKGESHPSYQTLPGQLPPTPISGSISGHESNKSDDVRVVTGNPSDEVHLLHLADLYFSEAHRMGSVATTAQQDHDMYQALIATGLGCLETLLVCGRLQPILDATVRWRYSMVVFEETNNTRRAEEALSHGITICDRHRFLDLKYDMQHLLVRVIFSNNPRAAMKMLDFFIADVEAYQHIPWVYGFRFLRASLSMDMATHQEILSAINQLKAISTLASNRGDKAVLATASLLEALSYLRNSSSSESIEHAQTALATARSSQLDPAVRGIPQLALLTGLVDLCCNLQNFDPNQALSKMQILQNILEDGSTDLLWTQDGVFSVPVRPGARSFGSTNGQVRSGPDKGLDLMINWMPKDDLYGLGYLLGGVAWAHRNTSDKRAEQLLAEGIKFQNKNLDQINDAPGAWLAIEKRQRWRQILKCHMQIQLIFVLCTRAAWTEAAIQLSQLKQKATTLATHLPEDLSVLILYLTGLISQGTGDITTALSIFQHPFLTFQPTHARSPLHMTLSMLSTINTLLLIRPPSHPLHSTLSTLLSTLSPYSTHSPEIHSAYNLILATTSTDSILRTKQYLQAALQAAKQAANNQLMCITLNFMSWKFFKGVVGDQAEKSCRTSLSLAKKGMDGLWISVAAGALADFLECQGRWEEAGAVRGEVERVMEGLSPPLKREVGVEEEAVCGAEEEARRA